MGKSLEWHIPKYYRSGEVLSNLNSLPLSCLHFQIYKEHALLRMKLKSVPASSKLSPAHILNGCSSAGRTILGGCGGCRSGHWRWGFEGSCLELTLTLPVSVSLSPILNTLSQSLPPSPLPSLFLPCSEQPPSQAPMPCLPHYDGTNPCETMRQSNSPLSPSLPDSVVQ